MAMSSLFAASEGWGGPDHVPVRFKRKPRGPGTGRRTPGSGGRSTARAWQFFVDAGPDGHLVDIATEVEKRGHDVCARVLLELEHRKAGRRQMRHDALLAAQIRAFRVEQAENMFWLLYGADNRNLVVLVFVVAASGVLPEGTAEVAERRWSLWRETRAR